MLWLPLNIMVIVLTTSCASASAMCLSPIRIPNLNYGQKDVGLNFLKDTSFSYLSIPCGHCEECIHNRQVGYLQRCQVEAKYSHTYAVMLSYNDSHLCKVQASDGKLFKYANWKHLQNMFKRLRKDDVFGRPFRYFAVSEFGGDNPKSGRKPNHRPHFHLLLFFPKFRSDSELFPFHFRQIVFDQVLKYWCVALPRSVQERTLYAPLLTYKCYRTPAGLRRNYDVQLVQDSNNDCGVSNVSVYITKYMLKESGYAERLQRALRLNYSDDEYKRIWSIVRPRSSRSLGFGLAPTDSCDSPTLARPEVSTLIRKYLDLSKNSGSKHPEFFNLFDGRPMSLSRYYINKYMTPDDKLAFILNNDPSALDGSRLPDLLTRSEFDSRLAVSSRKTSSVLSRPDVLNEFGQSDSDPELSLVSDLPDFIGDDSFDWRDCSEDFYFPLDNNNEK